MPHGTRVELGEEAMQAVAAEHDPSAATRGEDNFVVFAAEMEVYARARYAIHICSACPRGSIDGCLMETLPKRPVDPIEGAVVWPKATIGLMGVWSNAG